MTTSALLPGDPPVEILLRRSARARRISLRVSALDGRVTLSVPRGVPEAEALAFAAEKSDWIRKHLDRNVAPLPVAIGGLLTVDGRDVPIIGASGRAIQLTADGLCVPGRPDTAAARLRAWLKARARDRLAPAVDGYAARIGRTPGRLTLRDTRSRWGSCSSRGDLMFSWRLAMAPPAVLDYVAAHEVAHLAELNHSPAYWRIVERICPGYQEHRAWLRQNGALLHRYRFGD